MAPVRFLTRLSNHSPQSPGDFRSERADDPSDAVDSTAIIAEELTEDLQPGDLARSREGGLLRVLYAVTCAKDAGPDAVNEDVYALDEVRGRAAVFDGATESFAARRWASIVAEHWRTGEPGWLESAQEQYHDAISSLQLSWAQEAGARRGSFTTVAAVHATQTGLSLQLVGDSCVLLTSGSTVVSSHPLDSADQFTSAPQALSSDPADSEANREALEQGRLTVPWASSDFSHVLLATDAIAGWLLVDDPSARSTRLSALLAANDDRSFGALVETERAAGRLKRDDSTVVVLKVQEPS
jgi:hypothetical protein